MSSVAVERQKRHRLGFLARAIENIKNALYFIENEFNVILYVFIGDLKDFGTKTSRRRRSVSVPQNYRGFGSV